MRTQTIIRRTKSELKADLIIYLERTLGIRFNRMQERLRKPALYLFTDKTTRSSFGAEKLLDVPKRLKELRGKFQQENYMPGLGNISCNCSYPGSKEIRKE